MSITDDVVVASVSGLIYSFKPNVDLRISEAGLDAWGSHITH